ncbi:MAG TPA: ribonuclease HII [Rhodothermales bacterium]|nr:ribonuclease HII [Rhodothermales bacterium]
MGQPSSGAAFDQAYFREKSVLLLAGVDEAGRGCLAGPVVAAAVILPPDLVLADVTDSKRLTATQRETTYDTILQHAISIGVGICSPAEIDQLNILWAAMEAMKRAVQKLDPAPDFLLIDGNRIYPNCPFPAEALVKGDARSQCTGAASIVAKVTRDRMMHDLHTSYPDFGFAQHKGYPTQAHYAALVLHGPTPEHRRSFRLCPTPNTQTELLLA